VKLFLDDIIIMVLSSKVLWKRWIT